LSVRSVEELVAVGEPEAPVRAPRAKRDQPAELTALAELLSEALETRVTIEMGRRNGKLVVEFAAMDDLERILGQLAPGALEPSAGEPEQHEPEHHEPEQHHHEGGGQQNDAAQRG
jgi:ParB family chromosome partitioning protein